MANRQLTGEELEALAAPLLNEVRARLVTLSAGDTQLLWALRRKLAKKLGYDERGKPMYRVALKRKRRDQENLCAICRGILPFDGAVLDRLEAMSGYTDINTRLVCPSCDAKVQRERGYK
jgi:hypothetical protein